MLKTQDPAPDFSIPDQNNQVITLSDFKGKKNVVLYFYPKDDTPGCTIEANQFTALAEAFEALDTVVIGVSKDSCDSHKAFIEKHGLQVVLLADTTGELCERYDVWRERKKYGFKRMGILRSTFVINKEGRLAEVMYDVKPEGHAQEILEKVERH
ncbi:MAG: peroxiredoxin [Nitrospiria bacterium]